jgi:hypothetical protein
LDWLDSFVTPRRRKRLSRADSLAAKPVRNPSVQWEMVDGKTGPEALLTVPPPKSAWMPLIRVIAVVPSKERRIQLDEVGSFVWQRCEGERTVQDLCDALCEHYRLSYREGLVSLSLSYREGLVSLTTYLRQLGRRGLVAFAVERPAADEGAEPGALTDEGPSEKTQEARPER